MRLSKVRIRNFRSIADVTLSFEIPCRVLVGINESGKSNILHALALLDPEREPMPDDLRDFAPRENPHQEAIVSFEFLLERNEREQCYEEGLARVLATDVTAPILRRGSQKFSLSQVFEMWNQGRYTVDLRTGKRVSSAQFPHTTFSVATGWKKPSESCPSSFAVEGPDGTRVPLRSFAFVQKSAAVAVPSTYLQDIGTKDVDTFVAADVNELVRGELPDCVFWSYSEDNLLPSRISLTSFVANPSSCAPLRHMFALADFRNAAKAIAEAQERSTGLRNLLDRVATRSTEHMHKVWKEYRGVKIELAINGAHIEASIKDRFNHFELSRRSDGFKRFVTFLLMISAQAKTRHLVNTLYLQDEPDIGLHPSGARYLRDELIKISKANNVVFSTHSPFMIDKDVLGRHLIVEKRNEVTSIREADESNIVDEEVIYNALGHSIFENLKAENIIFEGWRDKRLFQIALDKVPGRFRAAASVLSKVGVCHARGVKDIGRVAPMLELANRKWIVVSDSDIPAREHQRLYDGQGPWYRYDQLTSKSPALTSEDFIVSEKICRVANRAAIGHSGLANLSVADFSQGKPKLQVLKGWLQVGKVAPDDAKAMLEGIKEELFADLRPDDVEDTYYDLLQELSQKLKK